MSKSILPLQLALFLGTFSYCLILLVSREAPIDLLLIGGVMALAVVALSIGAMWKTLSKPN